MWSSKWWEPTTRCVQVVGVLRGSGMSSHTGDTCGVEEQTIMTEARHEPADRRTHNVQCTVYMETRLSSKACMLSVLVQVRGKDRPGGLQSATKSGRGGKQGNERHKRKPQEGEGLKGPGTPAVGPDRQRRLQGATRSGRRGEQGKEQHRG